MSDKAMTVTRTQTTTLTRHQAAAWGGYHRSSRRSLPRTVHCLAVCMLHPERPLCSMQLSQSGLHQRSGRSSAHHGAKSSETLPRPKNSAKEEMATSTSIQVDVAIPQAFKNLACGACMPSPRRQATGGAEDPVIQTLAELSHTRYRPTHCHPRVQEQNTTHTG